MSNALDKFKYLKSLFPPDFVASLSEESFLHRLLVNQRPKADVWRQHINDCLELAYRYNLVDADLEARLKKGDWESWQANINELKAAKFLENIFGVKSLRWHPQGREGKVGEFEIISSDLGKSIFVEVKTIFPRELEALEQRVTEKLRRYAEQVPIPSFLSVHIEVPGISESFSGKKFKNYLSRELPLLKPSDLRQKSNKLPDYKDHNTGLQLKVETLAITPEKEEKSCHIGIIGGEVRTLENEEYIKHSLRKAYEQLPSGKQPCLVILCSSTAFPIDEDDMLNALLGTLALHIYQTIDRTAKVPEPEWFRKLDGFFHSQHNRQLSASGVYREKLIEKELEKTLEIYHNSFASNPVDDSIFKGRNVRQLVGVNGQMKWMN